MTVKEYNGPEIVDADTCAIFMKWLWECVYDGLSLSVFGKKGRISREKAIILLMPECWKYQEFMHVWKLQEYETHRMVLMEVFEFERYFKDSKYVPMSALDELAADFERHRNVLDTVCTGPATP